MMPPATDEEMVVSSQQFVLQQRVSLDFREKRVEVCKVVLQDVVQEVPQVLVQERIVAVPEVQQIESLRQVPGEISYEDYVKEVSRPVFQANERVVEVPCLLHAEYVQEVPQPQPFDVFREVLRPQVQVVPKHVEKNVVQFVERPVPVTMTTVQERVVEVPRTEVMEVIREVPVCKTQQVEKEVPMITTEVEERIVEVPIVEIQEEVVEVPRVVEGFFVKEVPRYDIQFIDKKIEKPIVEYVEKVVEVPHVTYEERLVYVPEVEIREVVRQVPKAVVQYIDKRIPKRVVQWAERTVEVPSVLREEFPYEVPAPMVVETTTEVPRPVYHEIPREVQTVVIEPREIRVEQERIVKADRVIEMPQVQVVDLHRQVLAEQVEYVEKKVPRFETQVVEKLQEVPSTLVQEIIVEVPQIQFIEALSEQADLTTTQVVKQIPKVIPEYVEKVVDLSQIDMEGSFLRSAGYRSAPSSLSFRMPQSPQSQTPRLIQTQQLPASPMSASMGSTERLVIGTPRALVSGVVGTWLYEDGSYDIGMREDSQLYFTQIFVDDRAVSGMLAWDGMWLVTMLTYEDGEQIGMLRMRFQDGRAISNFKKLEGTWEADIVATLSGAARQIPVVPLPAQVPVQRGPSPQQMPPSPSMLATPTQILQQRPPSPSMLARPSMTQIPQQRPPSPSMLARPAMAQIRQAKPPSPSVPARPAMVQTPQGSTALSGLVPSLPPTPPVPTSITGPPGQTTTVRCGASIVQMPMGLTVPPSTPVAMAAIDSNSDGHPNMLYVGIDRNGDGIPDALQNRSVTVYLPKEINGNTVLVQVGSNSWCTKCPDSQTGFGGLSYRRSKNLEDRVEQGHGPVWDAVLDGTDEGDGWVRMNVLLEVPSLSSSSRSLPAAPGQLPPGQAVAAAASVVQMPSNPSGSQGPTAQAGVKKSRAKVIDLREKSQSLNHSRESMPGMPLARPVPCGPPMVQMQPSGQPFRQMLPGLAVPPGPPLSQRMPPGCTFPGPPGAAQRSCSVGSTFRNPRLSPANAFMTPHGMGSPVPAMGGFDPQASGSLTTSRCGMQGPGSSEPDAPGRYRIIAQETIVSDACRLGGPPTGRLQAGQEVIVVEVAHSREDSRMRGRVENPAGWISLLNTQNGYRWAQQS